MAKAPKPARIVDLTNRSIFDRLHKLTELQLSNWLAPAINEIAFVQAERVEKILSAARTVDQDFQELLVTAPRSSSTWISSDGDSGYTSFTISHLGIYGKHPYSDGQLRRGVISFPSLVDVRQPEEVDNALALEKAARWELDHWCSQFSEGDVWSDAALGKMCAFSPLYRACLQLPPNYSLPVYKYGPRGVDAIKCMSPELVRALQIASNLETEETASF